MTDMKKIDLHMHSTVSDGTDTPRELLDHVREAGIALFALTDHDAVKGCKEIRGLLSEDDPKLVTGVEFSCRDGQGKYHILGYRYDPDSASILDLVERGHRYRIGKVKTRLALIRERFGFAFSEEDIRNLLALDNPGKPHIANLMVRYGYAPSKQTAIREYLNRLHFQSEYISPEDAIRGILAGGGIPVLAHPAFGSGEQMITGSEMEQRLRRLTGYGLQGVEAFYSEYTPELTAEALAFAEMFELVVTAGSDYHGRNKTIPLGKTNLDRETSIPEGLKRFLRRIDEY